MRSLALGLALVLTSSGCAAMMKQPPPSDWQPQDMPRCSQSKGGVVIDGVFVSLYGIGALAAAGNEEGGLGLGLAVLGGLHLASAISGHNAASRCKKALDEHEAFLVAERNERKASAASRPERGARNGACYSDDTCDEGLTCHPKTKICVLAHFAGVRAEKGDSAEAEAAAGGLIDLSEEEPDDDSAIAESDASTRSDTAGDAEVPAREAPPAPGATTSGDAGATSASPATAAAPAAGKTKPAPRREPRRRKRATRPRNASFYRDFWREVRR